MFCPVFLPQFQAEHWSNLLLFSVTSSIYIQRLPCQTLSETELNTNLLHLLTRFTKAGCSIWQIIRWTLDIQHTYVVLNISIFPSDTMMEMTLQRFLSPIISVCSLKLLNIIKTPSIKLYINLDNVVRGKFLHNSRWRPLHQPICFQQNILKNVKVVLSVRQSGSHTSHVC